MKKCPSCKAIQDGPVFKCLKGDLSPILMSSRVCHLARQYGKPCINPETEVIESETFSYKMQRQAALHSLRMLGIENTLPE